jgi:NADH:ubiquinone oxidoreductase subunit 3 (subunit A)
MTGILQNYLPLVVFIGVASLIGLALLIAPFLRSSPPMNADSTHSMTPA